MACQLKWLGHGGWEIRTGSHTVLLDPFLGDNPLAPVGPEQVEADFVLVSHGHYDHIQDVPTIAHRTGATVISCFEIAQWLAKQQGIEKTVAMNIGGTASLPFGQVTMTLALHSSQLPDGSYGGNPAGFLIRLSEQTLYFACDTALFGDMQILGRRGLDAAVLPIGDLFTMGPDDSLEAIKLLQPRFVLPAHYNTWPPIAQDAGKWAERVRKETRAEPVVLQPGEMFTFPS